MTTIRLYIRVFLILHKVANNDNVSSERFYSRKEVASSGA